MGEIADMMLEGEMCQGCGEFLDDPQGFPGWCDACYRAHKTAKAKHKLPMGEQGQKASAKAVKQLTGRKPSKHCR